MKEGFRNISKIGRQTAGMTQARWAEAIDVSVEAVGQYEAGMIMPSDDVVTRMAEVSGMTVLGYWHLLNKSRVAAEQLPEVECVPIAQAVTAFLHELRKFQRSQTGDLLLQMAADGTIDSQEQETFDRILQDLSGIVRAALMIKYSDGGDPECRR